MFIFHKGDYFFWSLGFDWPWWEISNSYYEWNPPAAVISKVWTAQRNDAAADLRPKDDRWTLQSSTHWPKDNFFFPATYHPRSPMIHGQLVLLMATGPAKKEHLHSH